MTKLYAYAIGALLVVIAVGSAWWYVESLRSDLAQARTDLATEKANTGKCAAALVQANDATAAAEDKAKIMQSQAQALIDGAATQKGRNNVAAAAFATKVTQSAKAPDCKSLLEATLCPALSGY